MTKRGNITIGERTYRLPVEELQIERLLHKAKAAYDKSEDADDAFKKLKAELVDLARKRRDKTNTVHLGNIDIEAVIRFGQSISFSTKGLEAVREKMGGDEFKKIFTEEVAFKAENALELFMKEAGHAEEKRLIQEAMKVTNTAPKFSFEQLLKS